MAAAAVAVPQYQDAAMQDLRNAEQAVIAAQAHARLMNASTVTQQYTSTTYDFSTGSEVTWQTQNYVTMPNIPAQQEAKRLLKQANQQKEDAEMAASVSPSAPSMQGSNLYSASNSWPPLPATLIVKWFGGELLSGLQHKFLHLGVTSDYMVILSNFVERAYKIATAPSIARIAARDSILKWAFDKLKIVLEGDNCPLRIELEWPEGGGGARILVKVPQTKDELSSRITELHYKNGNTLKMSPKWVRETLNKWIDETGTQDNLEKINARWGPPDGIMHHLIMNLGFLCVPLVSDLTLGLPFTLMGMPFCYNFCMCTSDYTLDGHTQFYQYPGLDQCVPAPIPGR